MTNSVPTNAPATQRAHPEGGAGDAALFAAAPAALCILDQGQRFLAANAAMEELLGVRELEGRRLGEVAPQIAGQLGPALEQALRRQRPTAGIRIQQGDAAWVVSVRPAAEEGSGAARAAIAAQPLAPGPAPDEHAPALLAAIVQSSSDAIISKTLDGVITSWNAAAQRLFGYSALDAIGRHITILIPENRHEEERLIREQLTRGEIVEHFETVRRTRDGRLLDVSITISPVLDSAGRVIGASNITRDITEQKRARQALRESERRFRTLADAAPVLIWMSGRHKEGVYFSRPWLEFTGLALEAQLGAGWIRCVHPEDAERLAAIRQEAFEKHEPFTADFRLRRADGEYRWMRENAVPRLSAAGGGDLLGYIGACVDITEMRHAAEELERSRGALRERAAELQTLLDVLPVGVYLAHDPDCASITANAAGRRQLRLPAPDTNASKTARTAAALPFRVFKDGKEVPGDQLPMQRVCRTGEPVTGEICDIVFEDGDTAVLYEFVSPLRHADGDIRGAVAAFVDLTEQKRAEETLRQRARQQAVVARLGQLALSEDDLDNLFQQAVSTVAETLEVDLCKTLELLPGGEELLLRAGVGWQEGLAGRGRVSAGSASQAGFTIQSSTPVIVEDLRTETRFSGPPLLHDHGVISGISCIIPGGDDADAAAAAPADARPPRPWGVLGAHSRAKRTFTDDDVNFLRTVANVLGSAIRQRRADQALRESQARLSLAMIAGRMGAWDYDVASGHVTWSSTLEQIHGIPIGSFGGTFQDYQRDIHPDDRQRVFATIERALSRREAYQVEYRIIRPDGATVWLEARGHVVVNEHGEAERLIGVCADVTERRSADRALRESEQRFRTMANSAPVLIWVNDTEGATFVNQVYLDFLGVEAHQVLGFKWAGFVHPEDREEYLKAYQKAAERRQPFEGRFRFRRRDGEYRWMKSMGVPRVVGDRLAGYVGSTVDITDVLEAEQALRRSFDQLRVIYSLSDAVARADSLEEINRLAVEGVIEAVGVDRASLLLFDDDGVLRFRAWHGLSDRYRAAVEGHSPWTRGDVDPEPIVMSDVGSEEGLGELRQLILAEGIGALAFVPLTSAGRLLGKLMLYSNRPRRFAAEELRLAQAIAGHIAFAIESSQAEQALRDSEERFRALTNATSDVIYRMNPDWTEMRHLDGRNFIADTLEPSTAWLDKYVHPGDQPRLVEVLQQAIESKGTFELEHRVIRADGSIGWTYSRAIPVLDDQDEIIEWFGAASDVTQRKLAEQLLQGSHETFRQLVENSPFGVYVVDADFRLAMVSAGAQKVFQNVRPLIGRDFGEVLRVIWPEPAASEFVALFQRALASGEPYHAPSTVVQRADIDETEAYDWKIERIGMPDGRYGVVCHFYDWTDRQRLETALREQARTLAALNRVGAALSAELDTQKLMQAVTDAATELSGAQFGAFFFNTGDGEGESYALYTLSGAPRAAFEKFGMPRNTPMFKPTFTGEGVIRSDDITQDPRYGRMGPHHGMPKGHLPVRSYLAVPVLSRSGAVLGGLFFGHPEAGVFTEQAEHLVSGIASHAAIALDNARLYEAARASEQRYRQLTNLLPAAVYACDASGVITYYNPKAAELWGRAPAPGDTDERFCGSQQMVLDGKVLPHEQCPMAVALRDGSSYREQPVDIRRPDGSLISVRVNIDPIRDDSGQIVGAINVFHDVTDLARAEQALRESEERFRTLADNIAQFAWMADGSGSLFWYNRRWFDYTGTTLEQMQGWGWRAVHHPDHVERVTGKFRRHVEAGEPWEDTFPLRSADGAYRWFLSRAVPIRDAEGNVIRWFGTNTDITDAREAHEERMKYVALVENSLDFIAMASPAGDVLYLNPAARRLIGLEPDEDVTRLRIDDVIPEDLRATYREDAIPQTLENGYWEGETRFRLRGGDEAPMYQTMFLIRYPSEGGEVCLATVAQNISARKRHEEQMRLVMAELNHRVKNTLAVVESIARQTLRSSTDAGAFITSFGERLRGLARVHGMLTQAQWEGVPLHELVAAELNPRIAAPEQADIEGPPLTLAPGAALTLHMTLHELATNAAKHGSLSAPEGRVMVRWRLAGGRLLLEWQERGGPRVAPPATTGFGTRVLSQLIEYELGGRCIISYDPAGIRCQIEAPWQEAPGDQLS